ncbi:MAG: hypothetical protein EOO43_17810 [Flavobacterium sp.]|nr:MAG: hypothetical protein EOO43_17810 [Flavobacterium sp.]
MPKMLHSKIQSRSPQSVKEVRWTNVEDLKREIQQNVPFILKGLVETWNTGHWCFDHFEQHYGNVVVNIQTKEELTLKDEPVKDEKKTYVFRNYLKALKENQHNLGYLSQTQVQDIHLDLLNDFKFPKVFHHPYLSVINLWIGPKGTKSKVDIASTPVP